MTRSDAAELTEPTVSAAEAPHTPSLIHGLATLSGMALVVTSVGFVRNAAIAAVYGATGPKDAYDIAAGVPQWLLYLFGLDLFRSLSGAIFARLDARQDDDPSAVLSTLLTIIIVVGAVVSGGAILIAPSLVRLIGPGLPASGSLLCTQLLRILLPTLLLAAIAGLLSSILNAHHRYVQAEIGNLLLRGFVLAVVLGAGWFFPIHLLAAATLGGLLLAVTVQWLSLRRLGYRYRPMLHLRSAYVREAGRGALPLLMAMVISQSGDLYLRRLLSYGQEGVVASYGYALVIYGLSITLLARPLAQTFAPRISRHVGLGDLLAARELFARTVRLACLFAIASIAMIAASGPSLVAVLFQRGQFDLRATGLTATFLLILVWATIGQCISSLCVRSIYAFGRSWRMLVIFVCRDALRISIAAVGFGWYGPQIVPAAVTAGALTEGLLGMLAVRGLLHRTGVAWARWLPRMAISALACGLAAYGASQLLPYRPELGFWYHAGRIAIIGPAAIVAVVLAAALVRMEEALTLLSRLATLGRGAWALVRR